MGFFQPRISEGERWTGGEWSDADEERSAEFTFARALVEEGEGSEDGGRRHHRRRSVQTHRRLRWHSPAKNSCLHRSQRLQATRQSLQLPTAVTSSIPFPLRSVYVRTRYTRRRTNISTACPDIYQAKGAYRLRTTQYFASLFHCDMRFWIWLFHIAPNRLYFLSVVRIVIHIRSS